MLIPELQRQQADCALCPRLVAWRELAAQSAPPRFKNERYWGRAVPSLGNAEARLLLVGLAPAAHGANRTGRMFTGDQSGLWLFRALFKAGFCTRETSESRDDGLELFDCYLASAAHCAPPANKPLPGELANCRLYLLQELRQLTRLRVVLGLGKIGFDAAFDALRDSALIQPQARPKFGHGACFEVADKLFLLGTCHPCQQNTFTKRLTQPMLDAVFVKAKELLQ